MNDRDVQYADGQTATCHVCEEAYDTLSDLLRHMQTRHPDDELVDTAGIRPPLPL